MIDSDFRLVVSVLILLLLVVFLLEPHLGVDREPQKHPLVTFQYQALDQYYLECRSYHGGTGEVIIYSDASTELICADGHKAGDPRHPPKRIIPSVRRINSAE